MRGRVAVGLSSDTEFNARGKTGGEKTHVLSGDELPAHAHAYGPGVTVPALVTGASAYFFNAPTGPSRLNPFTATDLYGGGAPHNNVQPYQVVNYIIKT